MSSNFIIYDINNLKKALEDKVLLGQFYFTDVNLMEWLKSKPRENAKIEFKKIDDYILKTGSKYYFANNCLKQENILNNRKYYFDLRFKTALSIAEKTNKKMVDMYLSFCFLLPLMIFVKKNKIKIENGIFVLDDEHKKYSKDLGFLNTAITKCYSIFKKRALHKTARDLFKLNKNQIAEQFVLFYNDTIQIINKYCPTKFHLIQTKNFNYEEIVLKNNVTFSSIDVETLVSELYSFNNKEKETTDLYITLYKSFLTQNNRFEFNDVVDFYQAHISREAKLQFVTGDKRAKSLLGI